MANDTPARDRRLPPLTMLRAFEAAARTRSMRAAAHDLNVSHTVVSRHVRNLEHWFCRKLVRTGPRGVQLTGEGEVLFAAVATAFEIIGEAADGLNPGRLPRRLTIWCCSGLATRWLTPRLSELEQTLHGAEIELRATEQKPDFALKEADAFIGYDPLPKRPEAAIELLTPRMFPVVSRNWLERHKRPETIEELARLPLIHEGSHRQWSSWFEAQGHTPSQLRGPKLSNANLNFDAALAGQGIALVNGPMAADELASGRLVEPLATDVVLGSYYLLIAPDRTGDRLMSAFAAWLLRSIRQPSAAEESRSPSQGAAAPRPSDRRPAPSFSSTRIEETFPKS